ncbi:serine-rich coiled-coil domain-containing protein 2-like [Xenentodon cancila]
MSAPSLVNCPIMPTMVSRLPKFGSRPRSQTAPAASLNTSPAAAAAGSTRLTNGFYHHPGPAVGAAPPPSAKQNGFIRVPSSFSMKWRKENGTVEDGRADGSIEWRGGKGGNTVQYSQQQHNAKKSKTSAKGCGQPAASTSPESSPRSIPVSKIGSRSSKQSQATSGLANSTQKTVNGSPGPKPRAAASSSLRQPQSFVRLAGLKPSSGSGSRCTSPHLKKPPASRSQSSDSLGSVTSVQLTENDRFRSRSLTQVRQLPSPTLTLSSATSSSLPRSPSVSHQPTNKAARCGPPSSSIQAPTRASLIKSPVSNPKDRAQSSASSGTGFSIPSALKKPLLTSFGPTSRPSGISYKMSRPSLMKQSRPLRVTPPNGCGGNQRVDHGQNRRRNSLETPSTTDNSPEITPDVPETEGVSVDPVFQEVSMVAETLEDMSLSSTSSLDRNDISQEYMDDFDNLGNGGVGILLLSSKNDEDDSGLDQSCTRFEDDKLAETGVDTVMGLSFLDDGVDWTSISGEQREHRLTRLSRRRRSSQVDYHDQGGSSLDLSPSDSCGSGGTYMWDEEGLEPLGDAATHGSIHTSSNTTHPIGSFDSDINSIDILNNLDSCDLADDDLMLDVDFQEDASLHSDGDGMSHMAEWRRRQLCWGTQDVQNDNESEFQCFKLAEDPGNKRLDKNLDGELILNLCPSRSACLSPGSPGLGLDVEELAEDCSAVRSQLEFLQRILLQEEDVDDDTLTTDTLSPEDIDSSRSSDSQVQALLQEVQQLREELRSRDQTIAQLTLQLTVPTVTTGCRCKETKARMDRHTQTSVQESESVGSQTPWNAHAAFSPVPFLSPPWQYQRSRPYRGRPKPSIPPHLARKITGTSLLQPGRPGTTDCPTPAAKPSSAPRNEEEEVDNKRGASSRSLLPPPPSKLRLFLSHSSDPTPQKTRASRQLSAPCNLDDGKSSGLKLKAMAFTSGSSRLPKPKSH